MKKFFYQMALAIISTVCVFNSCQSDDLQNIVEKGEKSPEVIVENPFIMGQEEAAIEAEYLLKRFSDMDGIKLRIGEINKLSSEIKACNITVPNPDRLKVNTVQKIPIYTIQYKDNLGKDAAVIVTVGDKRIAEKDKILMLGMNGKTIEDWTTKESADFFKDRIAGYVYSKLNNKEDEIVNLRYETGDKCIYYLLPMQCDWEQNRDPYNRYAKGINGRRFYAGCVAVAMAQIMAHHRWPLSGTFPRYTNMYTPQTVTVSYKLSDDDYRRMIYARDISPGDPYEPLYKTVKEYVANLIAECGYRVKMMYGMKYHIDGSFGSYAFDTNVPNAFAQMGYSCDGLCEYNLEKIKNDLKNMRPVYMSGQSIKGGGHAYTVKGIFMYPKTNENYLSISIDDPWFTGYMVFNSEMFTDPNYNKDDAYTYRYNCSIITNIRPNKN
jgi:Peptidase C10 family.